MARHHSKAVSALTLCITVGWCSLAHADAFHGLTTLVQKDATVVVGVDHRALRKHPAHGALLDFVHSQGHLKPLAAMHKAGLSIRPALRRSVSFRKGPNHGLALFETALKGDAFRRHGQTMLSERFEQGVHQGYAWFSVGATTIMADMGQGRWLAGPSKEVKRALKAIRSKVVMTQRADFKRLRKSVDQPKTIVWAVSFVPKSVRSSLQKRGASDMAHVESSSLMVSGSGELNMLMRGITPSAVAAEEVARAVNGKIQRKILDSRILNALVGSLVRQLKVDTVGHTVRGRLTLTSEQAGIVTRYGPRVIRLLR